MRWNWQNKPRYKGQVRPSDGGPFPAVGLDCGIRRDLTPSGHSRLAEVRHIITHFCAITNWSRSCLFCHYDKHTYL
jgi:hypothetical protein